MSDAPDAAPSAVRVELLDGEELSIDDIEMPGPDASGPNRLSAFVVVVVIAGVIGALWWLSNLGTTAEPPPDQATTPAVNEANDEEPTTTSNDTLDPAGEAELRLITAITPTYVVTTADDQLLAGGEWIGTADPGLLLGRQQSLQEFPLPDVLSARQLVGMADNGDRFVAFSTVIPDVVSTAELVVHGTESGRAAEQEWAELARFPIDGFVRTVSARDGQWAAIIDRRAQSTSESAPMQTQILTGRIDGAPDETSLVELAPNEFLSSFAATNGGFYAVVIRTQLGSISDSRKPAPELRLWTEASGWEVLEQDFSPAEGQAARLLDGGPSGIFVSWRTDLYRVDPSLPARAWPLAATGKAVTGALDESFTPEISPSLTGSGFLIVDNTIGPVRTIWISSSGQLWQRFEVGSDVENVRLLQIDPGGTAVLRGDSQGQPAIFVRSLSRSANTADSSAAGTAANTPAFQPEVQIRRIADGEWSTPVFSAESIDGAGFVGLSNVNGQVSLVESANGFDIDQVTQTNFPFGYFTNEMRTTSVGYHVVGQLGLFEDAVFTSEDGIDWERFEIEQIGTSTALQIDHFHRSGTTAAMAGSLGWADDLERTELALVWWDADGKAWEVPPRPCGDVAAFRCSITSLIAVSNGLVATHQIGDKTVLSTWSTNEGWRATTDPDADLLRFPVFQNATLLSVSPGRITVLGVQQLIGSEDGGQSWFVVLEGPPGVLGGFNTVSNERETAVFLSRDDMNAWVLADGLWTKFSLAEVELASPLAIADGVALFNGSANSQPAIVRFAPEG